MLQGFQKRQVLLLTLNVQYFAASFARPFGHIFTNCKKGLFCDETILFGDKTSSKDRGVPFQHIYTKSSL